MARATPEETASATVRTSTPPVRQRLRARSALGRLAGDPSGRRGGRLCRHACRSGDAGDGVAHRADAVRRRRGAAAHLGAPRRIAALVAGREHARVPAPRGGRGAAALAAARGRRRGGAADLTARRRRRVRLVAGRLDDLLHGRRRSRRTARLGRAGAADAACARGARDLLPRRHDRLAWAHATADLRRPDGGRARPAAHPRRLPAPRSRRLPGRRRARVRLGPLAEAARARALGRGAVRDARRGWAGAPAGA